MPKLFQDDSELELVLLDWDEAEDVLGNDTVTGDHIVAMEIETTNEEKDPAVHLDESFRSNAAPLESAKSFPEVTTVQENLIWMKK